MIESEVGVVYVTLLSLDALVESGAEVVALRPEDDTGVAGGRWSDLGR